MTKTHGRSKTRTYRIWSYMITRTTNPNSSDYAEYAGRGITVCAAWRSFENFLADMGEIPDGMSIDRIDNDKGYSKDNCRWTTPEIQSQNRRSTRLNPDLVREIRRRAQAGESMVALSKAFGESHQLIIHVVNRVTWKNVA